MKLTYDSKYNIACLSLREDRETLELFNESSGEIAAIKISG